MNFCVAILILKMEEKKPYFLHKMLYYFKKGKNTIEMQKKKKIYAVYGEDVTDQTRQKWLWSFMLETFLLGDAPQSGRLV